MLQLDELKVGSFYLPVFERMEPQGSDFDGQFRTDSPFYQYLGAGEFVTESGEAIDGFYDAELGLKVAVDAPDGFIECPRRESETVKIEKVGRQHETDRSLLRYGQSYDFYLNNGTTVRGTAGDSCIITGALFGPKRKDVCWSKVIGFSCIR